MSISTPVSYIKSNKLENFAPILTDKERRQKEVVEVSKQTGATAREVIEFREMFELVDKDKGGSIDSDELLALTKLMNMDMSETELDEMIIEIDTTNTGEVFFVDFVRCMLKRPDIDYTVEDVEEAFATLAGKGQPYGKIRKKNLVHELCTIGFEDEKLEADRVEEILALSEVDAMGYVDYDELVSLMMSGGGHKKKSPRRSSLSPPKR
ncbi:hypothetical protein TL16_g02537 [Triparma laevis f. inornata]|uniref:Calmodulin n=2 Tax=Triparma laevis TaxID=1534972 RepID=A0A9W6ZZ66_9STRA|nr:hypothetical protein TL16_g02537 [Triparma laevis f. inornata]GMH63044.1 hypothetical protein TrLO_g10679 [Triparma laevis f. longispina]